jgi:hypothetical protein
MSEMPDAGWYPDPGGSGGYRRWDGEAWTDDVRVPPPLSDTAPHAEPAVGRATTEPASDEESEVIDASSRPVGLWLVASGGVLVILGSILPWVSVSAPLASTSTGSGTDGDGIYTLLAGIAVLGVIGVSKARASANRSRLWLVLAITAFGVLCLTGYDFAYIHHKFGQITRDHPRWATNYGVGLFVVVLGGLAIGAGSLERVVSLRRSE